MMSEEEEEEAAAEEEESVLVDEGLGTAGKDSRRTVDRFSMV